MGRAKRETVFLLSPARCGGERGLRLIDGSSAAPIAGRLHATGGAPLGEVFTYLSSLYFRGKLSYARAFASQPGNRSGVYVITPGAGLLDADTKVTAATLGRFAEVSIDHRNELYVAPLARDARALAVQASDGARIVLLGSIASAKYVDPLLAVFGERLLFPSDFVGRGDMSRGGLLLRAARDGVELDYLPLLGAVRNGPRPPRLPREPKPGRRRGSTSQR